MGFPPAAAPQPHGLAPPAVFGEACKVAAKKAAMPPHVTAALGFSAGAMIGLGALLMSAVGGSSPGIIASDPGLDAFLKGAVGLPAGLTLVVLTGAELFTSNVFTMLSGVMMGYCKPVALVANWVISYFANFVGSVAMAWLSYQAHTMSTPVQLKAAQGIALMKVGLPFGTALAKGILCNWLVCLAVWGAMASPSISGKILAIFWPIAAFITLGFEHCVANMFLIPQGMFAGADIGPYQLLVNNLLPVTIGNIIGGTIFVAGIHFVAYHDKVDGAEPEQSEEEEESTDEIDAIKHGTNGSAKLRQRQTRSVALAASAGAEQAQPLMEAPAFAQPGMMPPLSARAVEPHQMGMMAPDQYGFMAPQLGMPLGAMPMAPMPRYA
eukprot:CAMPEP_0195106932 /NCGR_PEP_ID=MMETSP0448-20130528/81781_1 /TAXON_ID=66468 /ORGANISM="Heterocapsa triquestra, Strain CCMP 448" /LENGTH=380 /DNA_ID=CAMNT_0040143293 /DNA_START=77 /DNA_END=1219 /DNA_ORIENTATION=-